MPADSFCAIASVRSRSPWVRDDRAKSEKGEAIGQRAPTQTEPQKAKETASRLHCHSPRLARPYPPFLRPRQAITANTGGRLGRVIIDESDKLISLGAIAPVESPAFLDHSRSGEARLVRVDSYRTADVDRKLRKCLLETRMRTEQKRVFGIIFGMKSTQLHAINLKRSASITTTGHIDRFEISIKRPKNCIDKEKRTGTGTRSLSK